MNNYEYCAEWALSQTGGKPVRVLDYGCGSGQIVLLLRELGVNASGCDVYYGGGDRSGSVDASLMGGAIRRMQGSLIPFEDETFDLVVNNQVLEHVPNLDAVLAEVHRVLVPGGLVLSLFPDRGVWREGHCGIPFLHLFPKQNKARVYYAACLRSIGFGYYKAGKAPLEWARDFCAWLDRWTYYRSHREIESAFRSHFSGTKHVEGEYLMRRAGRYGGFVRALPNVIRELVVRKLAGNVIVACK